jgi:Zn-finger nucleic acid-binding protein
MALLDGPPAWHCNHCGTTVRLGPTSGESLRFLGTQNDRALTCPVCRQPLEAAVLDDDYRLDACAQCHGLLMDREAFAAAVTEKRQTAPTPSVLPKKVSPRQLDRRVNCPNCAATMITDWYYGPGHVVIDRCEVCDLVWLDGGELQTIVEAPGRDRLL